MTVNQGATWRGLEQGISFWKRVEWSLRQREFSMGIFVLGFAAMFASTTEVAGKTISGIASCVFHLSPSAIWGLKDGSGGCIARQDQNPFRLGKSGKHDNQLLCLCACSTTLKLPLHKTTILDFSLFLENPSLKIKYCTLSFILKLGYKITENVEPGGWVGVFSYKIL